MRLSIFTIVVLFVSGVFTIGLICPQQVYSQKTYEIDNTHSSLVFAVSHLGLSYTYGRFNDCSGTITLDNGKPSSSVFAFEIDAASVDTNNIKRDEHLRGVDFFDTDNYPKISFKSTQVKLVKIPYKEREVEKTKTVFQTTGELTLLGETKSVEIPLQLIAVGKGQDGEDRCGFFAKFIIKRSDFGMDRMTNTIGDQIAVTFSFEAKVKKAEDKDPKVDPSFTTTEFDTAPGERDKDESDVEEPSSPFDVFGEDNDGQPES